MTMCSAIGQTVDFLLPNLTSLVAWGHTNLGKACEKGFALLGMYDGCLDPYAALPMEGQPPFSFGRSASQSGSSVCSGRPLPAPESLLLVSTAPSLHLRLPGRWASMI